MHPRGTTEARRRGRRRPAGRAGRWLHAAAAATRGLWAQARRLLGLHGRLQARRWVSAGAVFISAHPPLLVGAVFTLLFAALYTLTATQGYTFDAVSYSLQIRRFEETGEWRWLLHPHHILFNGLGLIAHRCLRALWPGIDPLGALQVMNALLGGLGLALFAGVGARLGASRTVGAIVAAGLGISYGYWVCGTDGRVNIAAVVVLIAAAGIVVRMLDPDHATAPGALDRSAAGLGAVHGLAVLLHQSHLLFAPAAIAAILLSPGRPRRRGVLLYLGVLAVVCLFAYRQAAFLTTGAVGLHGIAEWATTYAHRGIWWSFDVPANLRHDVSAFTHALIARTADGGVAYRLAWALLLAGVALTAIRLTRLFGRAALLALAEAIRHLEPGEEHAARWTEAGMALDRLPVPDATAPRHAPEMEPEEVLVSPAAWVRVQAPAAPLPHGFTTLPMVKRRARAHPAAAPTAAPDAPPHLIATTSLIHRFQTWARAARAWWRSPATVRARAAVREWAGRPLLVETQRSLIGRLGGSALGRSLREHPRPALRANDEARLRLAPVLLVWMASYATFFTFWNPGYFVFWVPLLPPFWLLLAIGLARGRAQRATQAARWIGMTLAVLLMALSNGARGIAPLVPADNNARLQKALAVREHVTPRDTFVLSGAGDNADAEVYVPYFARCDVLSLQALLARSETAAAAFEELKTDLDRRLAARGKVYLHEELISSEGPYRVLSGRHGIGRTDVIDFLHRHYRLGSPTRWEAPGEGRE